MLNAPEPPPFLLSRQDAYKNGRRNLRPIQVPYKPGCLGGKTKKWLLFGSYWSCKNMQIRRELLNSGGCELLRNCGSGPLSPLEAPPLFRHLYLGGCRESRLIKSTTGHAPRTRGDITRVIGSVRPPTNNDCFRSYTTRHKKYTSSSTRSPDHVPLLFHPINYGPFQATRR